jgi:hypothetical protein
MLLGSLARGFVLTRRTKEASEIIPCNFPRELFRGKISRELFPGNSPRECLGKKSFLCPAPEAMVVVHTATPVLHYARTRCLTPYYFRNQMESRGHLLLYCTWTSNELAMKMPLVIISSDDFDLRLTLAAIFQRAVHNSDSFVSSQVEIFRCCFQRQMSVGFLRWPRAFIKWLCCINLLMRE